MFRRGFKAQCERRALEIRKSLGLNAVAPLQAARLAQHIGVAVWSGAEIHDLSDPDRNHLFKVASGEWSALTLCEADHFLVVYNPAHSPARTNSNIMHELSHIMLGHELTTAKQTDDGHLLVGNYDKNQEDEANWLAGALLLPRPALLWMRRRRMSDAAAIDHFGVSGDMLTWRIRMTGVDYQLADKHPSQRSG